jgi:Resolvase, N terminal domain
LCDKQYLSLEAGDVLVVTKLDRLARSTLDLLRIINLIGKSHSLSAAVHMAVRAGISRIHLIAPTTADFHDVNLEGRSGILATCGLQWRKSTKDVQLISGQASAAVPWLL